MKERLSRRDFLKATGLLGIVVTLDACGVSYSSTLPSVKPEISTETTPSPGRILEPTLSPTPEPFPSPTLGPTPTPESTPKPTLNPISEPTSKPTSEVGNITPGKVIYSANTRRKIVCLSFDDGGKRMREILNIANKRAVPMTFFPTGNAINADTKLYKDMFESGHEIGNHTQTHANLTTLTEKEIESQIIRAREALWNAVGKEVPQNLLRPPFGAGVRSRNDVDPDLLKAAKKLGYGIVMWNVTSAGTSKYATVESIKKRVKNGLKNGVIILEHPTLFDTTAFPFILDYTLSLGFKPQTISEGLK